MTGFNKLQKDGRTLSEANRNRLMRIRDEALRTLQDAGYGNGRMTFDEDPTVDFSLAETSDQETAKADQDDTNARAESQQANLTPHSTTIQSPDGHTNDDYSDTVWDPDSR
jgi:hypothetical protein